MRTGSPSRGRRIGLETTDGARVAEASTDTRGAFGIAGLRQGRYAISCARPGEAPLSSAPVDLGGFETVFIMLRLIPSGPDKGLIVESLTRDPGSPSSATTIDADQMRLLPSGGSVWSLIENQDMSATTDRIDVGGMRSDLPALFSARGGTSWTQNEYRLNGMSVTDPYDGGLPFYIPDVSEPPDGPAGKRRPSCGGPFPGRNARPRHEGRRERVRGLVLGVRRGQAPRELEHNARP